MAESRFRPSDRLRLRREIERVLKEGKCARGALFAVSAVRNALPRSRLGLVAGRRCGTAPVRNRAKRLLREAFRLRRETLPAGLDLVVRLHPNLPPERLRLAPFSEELVALAARAASLSTP